MDISTSPAAPVVPEPLTQTVQESPTNTQPVMEKKPIEVITVPSGPISLREKLKLLQESSTAKISAMAAAAPLATPATSSATQKSEPSVSKQFEESTKPFPVGKS